MSETFYARVARDLAEGIASGRFPVGSRLPRELDLCTQYEASRHTVRAAIQELQGLGLVSRKKRAGTRVENSSSTRGYRQSLASVEDLVQFGAAHRRVVQNIGDVVVDRGLARQLGCAAGRAFLRISSLRLNGDADAPPIGWTDVYIDPAYAQLRDVIGEYPEVLINDLIEARYGRRIAEIRQDVQALALSAKLARALNAKAGAPALRIIRRYLDQAGEAFEISVTIHPADRFTFSMCLRRERG
ncbi:MAG: GntR family transcriptional regulator [Hyphomicrobiales bacterium]|nr:GntR family transcriptional regulator [Hyphomicrobiales bacterium]MDE2113413.1 GntR family transcriptional regulator [Hyphomicrobiales bacterium]